MQPLMCKMGFIALISAVFVTADSRFPNVPECAVPCILEAVQKAGCEPDNRRCQCMKGYEIGHNAKHCVLTHCNLFDARRAQKAAEEECRRSGHGKREEDRDEESMDDDPTMSMTTESDEPAAETTSFQSDSSDAVAATMEAAVATSSTSSHNAAAIPGAANVAGGLLVGAMAVVAAL